MQLWYQRSDAVSVVHYSPPVDAASIRDVTVFLNIVAIGTGSVLVQAEQSLDPSDPNSWTNIGSSVSGATATNFTGLVGGYSAGTTIPVGPYLRFRATVIVTLGGVVWSATAVMRS